MPLGRMKRLEPLLAPEAAGERVGRLVAFRIGFGHDEQGTVTADLQVEAQLPLVCQRSLERYLEPVRRRSRLAIIDDPALEEALPADYEPVLVEHGRVALIDLVEDELLLALPEVPRNPAVAEVEVSTEPPEAVHDSGAERTHRPFEALAGLLKKGSEE